MKKLFKEFKEEIPYLNWRFFLDADDVMELKENYSISGEYEILGTDIMGNVITLKNKWLTIIDHEDPTIENDYLVTDEIDQLHVLLKKLITVKDYTELDEQDELKYLKELKQIKKELKECKKLAPKKLKDDFKDFIDEVESEIELLTD